MQPEGFSEGRFIDVSEENGVTKRMKMSHRKWHQQKICVLKKPSERFHDTESAKDKMGVDPNLQGVQFAKA